MLMATFSFYNQIEISECPSNFCNLQEKIKELYFLKQYQVEKSIISYMDEENEIHYIFNDDQYDKVIPIIEKIILKIELLEEDTYLTFAPLLYEQNNIIKENVRAKKDGKIIHLGIKCNLCKCENIEGIRFLCGICQDFNICQKCEEKFGKSHGHPLLKIRIPELAPNFFECKLSDK